MKKNQHNKDNKQYGYWEETSPLYSLHFKRYYMNGEIILYSEKYHQDILYKKEFRL